MESAVVEPVAHRIFRAVPDRNEIAIIHAKTHELGDAWPLSTAQGPAALGMDIWRHHLFVGCRSKTILMIDSRSGRWLTSAPISTSVTAVAVDPENRLAFAAVEDGSLTIAREFGNKMEVVQTLSIPPQARSLVVDTLTHRLYLPSADFGPAKPNQVPRMIPGSLKLLVYAQKQFPRLAVHFVLLVFTILSPQVKKPALF